MRHRIAGNIIFHSFINDVLIEINTVKDGIAQAWTENTINPSTAKILRVLTLPKHYEHILFTFYLFFTFLFTL